MIFHQYKTIYFHIGKTAGVSIERAFQPLSADSSRPDYESFYGYDANEQIYLQHATPAYMKERVPSSVFDDYYKFSVVRNPFARLVSLYFYLFDQHELQYGGFDNFVFELAEILQAPIHLKGTHYSRQTSHVYIDDELVCDLVLHFEDLDSSFDRIKQAVGLEANLEHHNSNTWSPSLHDVYEYFSPKLADTVREVYQTDFDTFGYSYDPRIIHPLKQV